MTTTTYIITREEWIEEMALEYRVAGLDATRSTHAAADDWAALHGTDTETSITI
jgi:hypothetical protein